MWLLAQIRRVFPENVHELQKPSAPKPGFFFDFAFPGRVLQDLARTVWVGAPELPRFISNRRGACKSLLGEVLVAIGKAEPGMVKRQNN